MTMIYSVLHLTDFEGEWENGICGLWDGQGWVYVGTWDKCFEEKHRLETNYVAENFFIG